MTSSRSLPPLAVLVAILAASLLPRLATLRLVTMPSGETIYYHIEYDERVFQTLINRIGDGFENYTVQGTPLLGELWNANYDRPMFFHPPAFVYTARLLAVVFPVPLVPVLLNLATIALVFFIGRRLYDDERGLWAAFLAAVCPVTWFISQKIWIDNMLIMMTVASVAAVIWAADRGRVSGYAIAGIVFGIAFLSKVTAVLVFPALLAVAWQRDQVGLSLSKAVAFLLPFSLMAGWWELTLYRHNGQILPSAFPDAANLEKFPFVQYSVTRPWYFYLLNIIEISPVYVLGLDAIRRRDGRSIAPALWFVVFLIAHTFFGLRGGGYQTRYLAAAYPALALLAAAPIPRFRTAGMIALVGLVGYGVMNAHMYAVLDTPHLDDFQFSAAELVVRSLREIPRIK